MPVQLLHTAMLMSENAAHAIHAMFHLVERFADFVLVLNFRFGDWSELVLTMGEATVLFVSAEARFDPVLAHLSLVFLLKLSECLFRSLLGLFLRLLFAFRWLVLMVASVSVPGLSGPLRFFLFLCFGLRWCFQSTERLLNRVRKGERSAKALNWLVLRWLEEGWEGRTVKLRHLHFPGVTICRKSLSRSCTLNKALGVATQLWLRERAGRRLGDEVRVDVEYRWLHLGADSVENFY